MSRYGKRCLGLVFNGTVLNNLGEIEVNNAIGSIPSEVYISEDIINNDILNTDGHIRLMGDWYNNSSFTSAMGTVFLQGHNQLISGSEESHFFNLTLDGTGYKTQEINAFEAFRNIKDFNNFEFSQIHTFLLKIRLHFYYVFFNNFLDFLHNFYLD